MSQPNKTNGGLQGSLKFLKNISTNHINWTKHGQKIIKRKTSTDDFKHIKRCSITLLLRELKIKITFGISFLTYQDWQKSKSLTTHFVGEVVGKLTLSSIVKVIQSYGGECENI